MTTLADVILYILPRRGDSTDRQLCEAIYGSDDQHPQINQECRLLANKGLIARQKIDGL
jgi:hypothetical protein